jgi:methyltransferase family protein
MPTMTTARPATFVSSTPATLPQRIKRSPLMPANWLPSLRAARILWRDYAHFRSVVTQQAIDADGKPVPWYTYPAIEFLSQLDFSEKTVFEYGSGMSTLFWAGRAQRVVSVEDDEQWHGIVAAQLPGNASVRLESDLSKFPDAIPAGEQFDVIVVDGPARGRTRLKCCRVALGALREGGLIILDNSDWLPESSRLLRESGLLEVDMTGFAPICGHVQTTSLYFHRAFNMQSTSGRQPMAGRGARDSNWERPPVAMAGGRVECDGEVFAGITDDVPFEIDAGGSSHRFRALSYVGGDGLRCIAVIDVDRARVLLSRHRPKRRDPSDADMSREVARIASMPWREYLTFINAHEYRRYLL